jgi:thiamine biosynthesis lipoprotein
MGTGIALQAHGPRAEEAIEAARRESGRLERLLSRFLSGSDVSRVNRAAGGAMVPVAEETMRLLERAAEVSQLTGGCFDATVAPLSDLWDYRRAQVPSPEAVARARALVNWRDVALDPEKKTARLNRPGQAIDLGGIGKGYAGDVLMALMKRYGVRSALANFGGGLSALGARPDGSAWRVGIRHPRADGLIGALEVADLAVVTSGDYERCFFAGGRRYHHLIDPGAGVPADSGLVSVTVVAERGVDADALSTAAFVGGLERGAVWAGRMGAGAVFIDGKLKVYVTKNLAPRFTSAGGVRAIVV